MVPERAVLVTILRVRTVELVPSFIFPLFAHEIRIGVRVFTAFSSHRGHYVGPKSDGNHYTAYHFSHCPHNCERLSR